MEVHFLFDGTYLATSHRDTGDLAHNVEIIPGVVLNKGYSFTGERP
jgi:hypothetical protein